MVSRTFDQYVERLTQDEPWTPAPYWYRSPRNISSTCATLTRFSMAFANPLLNEDAIQPLLGAYFSVDTDLDVDGPIETTGPLPLPNSLSRSRTTEADTQVAEHTYAAPLPEISEEYIQHLRTQNSGKYRCFYWQHDPEKYSACEKTSYKNFSHLRYVVFSPAQEPSLTAYNVIRQHLHRNHLKSWAWCEKCGEGLGDEYCMRRHTYSKVCRKLAAQRGVRKIRKLITEGKGGRFAEIASELREETVGRMSRNKMAPVNVWRLLFGRCRVGCHGRVELIV